ncbi:hypothetical protein SELMODRAFT_430636 [Selaginella moellendorffii]|uniref:Uncharacterized protein n=1 Tax=Selaginella moellendorffii TaxID=88036 RepID=D8TA09_SELML|nr:hypothetical protein SELMODRAFT_430636 [Selaginella moellendorffii]
MKNSSAWIIRALLLASLANDASDSSLEALAGSLVGQSGYVDGPLFNRPQICDNGAVFVGNLAIRKISKDGEVTTIAGGSQKWALIPVVLLGVCLGMPLGAFIIWKILDQRLRQAGDQLGNTERLLADVLEDDDLQAKLLASVFFGVAHEVKTKPTAPVKQDQDLHSLLGNTKDEPPDLIDLMELSELGIFCCSFSLPFPDSRNLTMELECLEKFQQEFRDKLKHS